MLLSELSDEDTDRLLYDWQFWGRSSQFAPAGNWRTWLVLAGRGWGKTRVGAEWVRASVRDFPIVNVIAPTADDARDIMIEGESGILAICPNAERPEYLPSKRQLQWPNGAKTLIFTADEPERLRGKQHMRLWADELAAWRYPEAWDQAMMGMRLGADPRVVATTTPRPLKSIRELIASPTTVVTRGNTYENADNLSPAFIEQIIKKYENTRLGRQELLAEILDDIPGALWTRAMIEASKVRTIPPMARIVVSVDPAVTSTDESDRTGIVVAGLGEDGRGYVLWSGGVRMSPDAWARKVVGLYHEYGADRVVAEANQGGDMVRSILRTVDSTVPIKLVRASKGKRTRAEPVAALWEQGRVSLVI